LGSTQTFKAGAQGVARSAVSGFLAQMIDIAYRLIVLGKG
jgi:hypothetical protein